jgi:hypothetical protein
MVEPACINGPDWFSFSHKNQDLRIGTAGMQGAGFKPQLESLPIQGLEKPSRLAPGHGARVEQGRVRS